MTDNDGLLFAYLLDGRGGGRQLDWDGVRAWTPADGTLWVHLDRTGAAAENWVLNDSGIEAAAARTLLVPVANRPRAERVGDALLVILRGINLNPGADPEDMVGMHMWIEDARIITARRRRLMAGNAIREALLQGQGPTGASDFLVDMTRRLVAPAASVIDDLDDRVDAVQQQILTAQNAGLRQGLRDLRQRAIELRRYLAPQREAMSRLQAEQLSWIEVSDRAYLREIADRTTRLVEDLDAVRERATVTQDELNNRLADQMNKTMYLLTIVSALLLPPALLTGLFGINVGGMPGIESPTAFAIIAASIPVLAVIEFIVLRRLRWI